VLGVQGVALPGPALGAQQKIISVACAALVRMDDAATLQLVQWARAAVQGGAKVHFVDVSLLVAAAWEAAGLNAHAQVYLRDQR
jgi:anti-anti-sigma regulatory factor